MPDDPKHGARITDEGRVTIPAELRERYGLVAGAEIEFEPREDGLLLRRRSRQRGREIVEHLTGRGTRQITTDDVMALTRGE